MNTNQIDSVLQLISLFLLYKRASRNLEFWHDRSYRTLLLRKRFDDNRNVKDVAVAACLFEEGEKELFNTMHYPPLKSKLEKKCFYTELSIKQPGGGVFEREVELPDWVFDYWHPLEKAQYPEFFAKHEDRKNQFVAWWEKQHGKADPKYLYD
ncbi:hypothetical protein GQX74_005640 [Glossina fuscipes]|nr:hypothetical protein GQX74_005640 [Glossina fuscipes]